MYSNLLCRYNYNDIIFGGRIPAPLGGSDYVPFFQGLGISSVDMSYNYLNNVSQLTTQ